MVQQRERRGFTLALGSSGWVRLALLERAGLLGARFNVSEARAQPSAAGVAPRPLAEPRLLSWRWVRHAEASDLFEHRLLVLEALGYAIVDARPALRAGSDWLSGLRGHGLVASPDRSRAEPAAADPHAALRHALGRVGLPTEALLEAAAAVLGIHRARLESPDPATIAAVDRDRLAVLLPLLLTHEDPGLGAVGERWLKAPTTVFELDPELVQRWLHTDGPMAARLAPIVRARGLALLGARRLLATARQAPRAEVRAAAHDWAERLGAEVGA